MDRYNFKTVETKWQSYWEKNKSSQTKLDKNKKKFYCLEINKIRLILEGITNTTKINKNGK